MAYVTPNPTPAPTQDEAKRPPSDEKAGAIEKVYPFFNDKERMQDFLFAEIGKLRPLVEDENGVRYQARQAVLYKDGTAKLWDPAKKDAVAPALRHKGPIRELTFFDEANILVTMSEDTVKAWDGLTGESRAELDGQTISPAWLSFVAGPKRFVTLDTAGRIATIWDATTLMSVGTARFGGEAKVTAVGLAGDGKTVVALRPGANPTVELWDVGSGRSFATIGSPSATVAEIFADNGKTLNKSSLERGSRFWDLVQKLAPSAGPRKD
jgi:WD40 repeat protein